MPENKKRFTTEFLASIGIRGDQDYEEWEGPAIRDRDGGRGLAWVVFEHENVLWRVEIEYHPEDWSGTNDLRQCESLEGERVIGVTKTVKVWEAV